MTVRIGVLGAGFIARYHLGMLGRAAVPHEVVAVHDPDRSKLERLCAAQGLPAVENEAAVLDAADAVYVCTWTAEHPRLVAEAAERGLAVFCEKPLAVDLDAARAVHEVVRRAGVINQVGLVLRDSPALRVLRHLVADPRSGRVMGVVFRDDQYLPVQGIYESAWRADPALAGAGTLLEHSIHDVDLLEWLFGPVRTVSARTAAFHGIEGIEDLAVATLEFESGAVASLTSVWHDVLARPSLRRMEVICERALYTLEGDVAGPVRWQRDGDEGALEGRALRVALREWGQLLRNPDEAFLTAVRDTTPATPDIGVAVRAHEVVDACYRSAAGGGVPVAVPPSDARPTTTGPSDDPREGP